MKTKKSGNNTGLTKPLIISGVLHIVLIGILIFGGDFMKDRPKPKGSMVQAVVIDPNVVHQQAQKIRSQREAAAKKEQQRLAKLQEQSKRLEENRKAEEARIKALKEQKIQEEKRAKEAEQQRVEKERQRKVEEERAAKAEAARKEKEEALKKAEQQRLEREKAAAAAAEKARQQEEAAKKAEQQRIEREKAAKEAAEKARKEQERLKRLERERKDKEQALDNIFDGLESEAKQNSSARNKYISSETDRFGAIYKQLIQQNLRIEDSFKGKSCRVNLNLIPAGEEAMVGSVQILGGDSAVCAATRRAIAQVNAFPLPKDNPDVVNKLKHINLTVEPE